MTDILQIKEKIELNHVGDGRVFLNFWDWAHGNDVVCEIRDGKLFLSQRDENGESLPEKEITFQDYLTLVEKSIRERTV